MTDNKTIDIQIYGPIGSGKSHVANTIATHLEKEFGFIVKFADKEAADQDKLKGKSKHEITSNLAGNIAFDTEINISSYYPADLNKTHNPQKSKSISNHVAQPLEHPISELWRKVKEIDDTLEKFYNLFNNHFHYGNCTPQVSDPKYYLKNWSGKLHD